MCVYMVCDDVWHDCLAHVLRLIPFVSFCFFFSIFPLIDDECCCECMLDGMDIILARKRSLHFCFN